MKKRSLKTNFYSYTNEERYVKNNISEKLYIETKYRKLQYYRPAYNNNFYIISKSFNEIKSICANNNYIALVSYFADLKINNKLKIDCVYIIDTDELMQLCDRTKNGLYILYHEKLIKQ